MNKRLAALFTALTLAFMLGATALAGRGADTEKSTYSLSVGAENTLCRIEGGALQININAADAQTLTLLDGVGEKLAARIVAYREEHGAFSKIDDLMNVEGIGAGKLNAIRDEIYCGAAAE